MECSQVRETLAAFALGALEESERQPVELHLEACRACAVALSELQDVVAAVGMAAPEAPPPEYLREAVLRRIPAPEGHDEPAPAASGAWAAPALLRTRWTPSLAVAAVVILALMAGNVYLWQTTQTLRDEAGHLTQELTDLRETADTMRSTLDTLQSGHDETLAMVQQVRWFQYMGASPDTTIAVLQSAESPDDFAIALISPSNDTVLLVAKLQPAPSDKAYQLWLVHDHTPAAGPTFSVASDGWADMMLRGSDVGVSLAEVSALKVTLEPANGSQSPSEDPIMRREPSGAPIIRGEVE